MPTGRPAASQQLILPLRFCAEGSGPGGVRVRRGLVKPRGAKGTKGTHFGH
jgi:hypothetical protein